MHFSKKFAVSRVTFDSSGKESVLVEQPTSNILPSTMDVPCRITLHTDKASEFDYTPLGAIFEIAFMRLWPEEKQ